MRDGARAPAKPAGKGDIEVLDGAVGEFGAEVGSIVLGACQEGERGGHAKGWDARLGRGRAVLVFEADVEVLEAEGGLGRGGDGSQRTGRARQGDGQSPPHRPALPLLLGFPVLLAWPCACLCFFLLGHAAGLALLGQPGACPWGTSGLTLPGPLKVELRRGSGRWAAAAGDWQASPFAGRAAAGGAGSRRRRGRHRCRSGRGPGAGGSSAVVKKTSSAVGAGVEEFGVARGSCPEEIRLRQPPAAATKSSPPVSSQAALLRGPLPLIDVLAPLVSRGTSASKLSKKRRLPSSERARGAQLVLQPGMLAAAQSGASRLRPMFLAPPAAPRSGCRRRRAAPRSRRRRRRHRGRPRRRLRRLRRRCCHSPSAAPRE